MPTKVMPDMGPLELGVLVVLVALVLVVDRVRARARSKTNNQGPCRTRRP